MLKDNRIEVERRAAGIRGRRELANVFGSFIGALADWDWFINPITFRDRGSPTSAHGGGPRLLVRLENSTRYEPDPRLACWSPSNRYIIRHGPPVREAALASILGYLGDLQIAAGKPIGWVVGEEFGRIGGRYHCHLLVTGVRELRRDVWWERGFQQFGRMRIEPFDPTRAAAFYTAKYAAKQLGGLHFGGTLAGVNLDALEAPKLRHGRGVVVVPSAALPREFFHLCLPRRHR
jgi:hypothetical protein